MILKLYIQLKNFFLKNIFIRDVKYCPYHKDAKIKKYKKKTNFRKLEITRLKKL